MNLRNFEAASLKRWRIRPVAFFTQANKDGRTCSGPCLRPSTRRIGRRLRKGLAQLSACYMLRPATKLGEKLPLVSTVEHFARLEVTLSAKRDFDRMAVDESAGCRQLTGASLNVRASGLLGLSRHLLPFPGFITLSGNRRGLNRLSMASLRKSVRRRAHRQTYSRRGLSIRSARNFSARSSHYEVGGQRARSGPKLPFPVCLPLPRAVAADSHGGMHFLSNLRRGLDYLSIQPGCP